MEDEDANPKTDRVHEGLRRRARGTGSSSAPKVIFAALDADIAREMEPAFADAGCAVISNSSAFRMHPQVPLVIPEINPDHLKLIESQSWRKQSGGFMVTNSNCSVMGLAIALAPLQKAFGIESVFVVTMQAISGAGYPGVASLDILGNVVPFIKNEEEKMQEEAGKLLGKLKGGEVIPAEFAISAHCNRVAVEDGHTESISIKLKKRATPEKIIAAWREYRGLVEDLKLPFAPAEPIFYDERPDRPAAASRYRAWPWHDRLLRPSAPLLAARLEVHHALAQHHSRSRRSRPAQRRAAQGQGLSGVTPCPGRCGLSCWCEALGEDMASASPLWQQVLFFIFGPPLMALLIRRLSRGWANIVQGGNVSEATSRRQELEFWIVLCFMYVMVFGIFLYAHLRR